MSTAFRLEQRLFERLVDRRPISAYGGLNLALLAKAGYCGYEMEL